MLIKMWRDWRRNRFLARNTVDEKAWREALQRLQVCGRMTPGQQAQLRDLALLFLHEKNIVPLEGLELSKADLYFLAIQACALVFHLGFEAYDGWQTVYVFPSIFKQRAEKEGRPLGQGELPGHLAGLAQQGGAVALAWTQVQSGGADLDDGSNVVFHEFAHKLDMQDGSPNGVPLLPADITPAEWKQTFAEAFEDFSETVRRGRSTKIDSYAATNPAEFFAVLTEYYMERPETLDREYPEVHSLMERYYRIPRLA
jgi:MtfA peptidase